MTPQLDEALAQLNAALTGFNAFLADEAAALASQDAERLAALLPRRNDLHRALAGRWLALAQLAGTSTPQGLADLRERLFAARQPPARWQELEALVHASERLNQVNGRLIEEQMQRTQVALQILQSSLSSRGGVYGADGRVSGLNSLNRRIDSA